MRGSTNAHGAVQVDVNGFGKRLGLEFDLALNHASAIDHHIQLTQPGHKSMNRRAICYIERMEMNGQMGIGS